jgi:hypothetical protein
MTTHALTLAQRTLIEKARNVGNSAMAVPLSSEVCAYLCGVVVKDLDLVSKIPEIPQELPSFFETWPVSSLKLRGIAFEDLAAKVFALKPDADTYFSCLATLHKSRLKYEQILQRQAFPTFDQIGPRGLLQFGGLPPPALSGMLYWRKWLYDLDNRAAQETGYLFEPILANAIGGTPVSAKRSPVKRQRNNGKGRQIDCVKQTLAYEFKMRVTIAASGQGRWGEELQFPIDCSTSGFTPVLVVLDPTPNPKLTEIVKAFNNAGGRAYVGESAWEHLETQAGPVMSVFLERYMRQPILSLMNATHDPLPPITVKRTDDGHVSFIIGNDELRVERASDLLNSQPENLPDDISD